MQRRHFLGQATGLAIGGGLVMAGCTTTPPGSPAAPTADRATRRREIDTAAEAQLSRLYSVARGTREQGERARGILVFPRVIEGGLVVGGEYGDGVLRVGGRPSTYHRLIGGSFGFQVGAQSKAIIVMFMTQEALDRFQRNNTFTFGADAEVAIARIGASGEIDTLTGRQPVVGFALTNVGAYAGLTLDGSRITRLDV